MDGRCGNLWEIQGKICVLTCQIAHKSWSDSTQLVSFLTKSTLGRVWARYYNWYGITGKLRAALLQHGWMEERINNYNWTNHLTVSPDHEGENPDVPAPNEKAQAIAGEGQTAEVTAAGQVPLQEGHNSACRRRKETSQVQAWYSCPPRDPQVPKIDRVADQKTPIPEVGEGDCPGLQVEAELCQWGNPGTAGGSGGLSCWPI